MKAQHLVVAVLLVTGIASVGFADDARSTKKKGEEPKESPGWVVNEETWWYPLQFDPAQALNNARYHYRRNEEKAAATEVRKAVSWLNYAAGHALPITKEKLETAATELTTVAKDLDNGNVSVAAHMDHALSRASHALAEWHYFKARNSFGKSEVGYAVKDLEAAAMHLQHAAASAHHQFGPDTITVFDQVRRNGKMVNEHKTIDNNVLGKNLDGIEKAVKEVGDTLKKAST